MLKESHGVDDDDKDQTSNSNSSASGNVVSKPSETDVLCGRGSHITRHHGNVIFRRIAKHNKELYIVCEKEEKYNLAESIVMAIEEQKGRFLESNTTNTTQQQVEGEASTILWTVIPKERAIRKTLQALRETPNSEKKKRKRSHQCCDEMPAQDMTVWQKLIRHVLPQSQNTEGGDAAAASTETPDPPATAASDKSSTAITTDDATDVAAKKTTAEGSTTAKRNGEGSSITPIRLDDNSVDKTNVAIPEGEEKEETPSRLQKLITATEANHSPSFDRSQRPPQQSKTSSSSPSLSSLPSPSSSPVLKSILRPASDRKHQSPVDLSNNKNTNVPVHNKRVMAKNPYNPPKNTLVRNHHHTNSPPTMKRMMQQQQQDSIYGGGAHPGQQKPPFHHKKMSMHPSNNTNHTAAPPPNQYPPHHPQSDRSRLQMLVNRVRKRRAAERAQQQQQQQQHSGKYYAPSMAPPHHHHSYPPTTNQHNISQLQMLVDRVRKRKLGVESGETLGTSNSNNYNYHHNNPQHHQYGNRVVPFAQKDPKTPPMQDELPHLTDTSRRDIAIRHNNKNKKRRVSSPLPISLQPDLRHVMIGDIFDEKSPSSSHPHHHHHHHHNNQHSDEGYSSNTITDEEQLSDSSSNSSNSSSTIRRQNTSSSTDNNSYQQQQQSSSSQDDYWENFFQSSGTTAAAV